MPARPGPGAWGAGPRTESELIARRPSTHDEGVFPRRLLLPGERILIEGRPGFWNYRRWWIVAAGTFLGFVLFGAFAEVAQSGSPGGIGTAAALAGALLAGAIATLFVGLLLAVLVVRWRRTAWALSTQRVLWVKGFGSSGFRFARREDVAGMAAPQGPTAALRFEVVYPTGRVAGTMAHDSLRWPSVRQAPRVYDFVQGAFALDLGVAQRQVRTRDLRERLLDTRSVCAYCGSLIDDGPSGPPATCPRCTAPLEPRPGPTASAPPPISEPDRVGIARPAAYVAASSIRWHRALGVLAILVVVLLGATALSVSANSSDAAATQSTLGQWMLILVGGIYAVWLAIVVKWTGIVRMLSRSLPVGSPLRSSFVGPIRRRWILAALATPGSAILLVGALSTVVSVGLGVFAYSSLDVVVFDLGMAGFVALAAVSEYALVSALGLLVASSEIPSIERRLRRGRRLAQIGLGLPTAVAGAVLYFLSVPPYGLGPAELSWAAAIGPVLLFTAMFDFREAYREWTDLAERVVPRGREAITTDGLPYGAVPGTGSRVDLLRGRDRARSRRRIALVVAVVVLVGVVGVVASLWLESHPASGGSPAVRPPIVIAAAGSTWAIPAGHYEFQSFGLNRNATLLGTFSASVPVRGYVMSSNEYASWQFVGGRIVQYQYGTGNVTSAGFHVPLLAPERWYLVVESVNSTVGVDVTWSATCEAVFS